MVHGQVFLKRERGWHFSCLIFSRVIIFTFRNYLTKSSSAAGCSQHQQTSTTSVWCILQLMMTFLYVRRHVLPSQHLEQLAADDDFVKVLYSLKNCVMHMMKRFFFCHHGFMKKSHFKLSKNELENIPQIKGFKKLTLPTPIPDKRKKLT